MTQIVWSDVSDRVFESGIDQGVLYPQGAVPGVAWSGLVSISESPQGGSPRPYYYDGVKYLNLSTVEEYEATIEAYGSPAEFDACVGVVSVNNGLFASQQPRRSFGLSYRTLVGNNIAGLDYGYKLHLVYNALAESSQRKNESLGKTTEAETYSWQITTKPPAITGYKPTAHFIVDSILTDPEVMTALTDLLYGTDTEAPVLPAVEDLLALFA